MDSDYVVFIIDTSGSMQSIWSRVTREVENVIRIHPRIKGFQILNDNGAHLISGYSGRWIPDTKARRDSVIRLFRNWKSASNSSPVEGLEVALKRYVNPNQKVSIYIFGDDYTGSTYDLVIRTSSRRTPTGSPGNRSRGSMPLGSCHPHRTGASRPDARGHPPEQRDVYRAADKLYAARKDVSRQ